MCACAKIPALFRVLEVQYYAGIIYASLETGTLALKGHSFSVVQQNGHRHNSHPQGSLPHSQESLLSNRMDTGTLTLRGHSLTLKGHSLTHSFSVIQQNGHRHTSHPQGSHSQGHSFSFIQKWTQAHSLSGVTPSLSSNRMDTGTLSLSALTPRGHSLTLRGHSTQTVKGSVCMQRTKRTSTEGCPTIMP